MAIDAVNKYFLLSNLGAAYTWESLDAMEFYVQQLIILCTNAHAKKAEMQNNMDQFYSEEYLGS